MKPLLLALPGNEATGGSLAAALAGEYTVPEIRRFPDSGTYVRIGADVKAREVILACSLDRPDAKFLPLIFVADTARETIGRCLPSMRAGSASP